MTLHDYWHLLNGLDWLYEMTDDLHVWKTGFEKVNAARLLGVTSPAHAEMFAAFQRGERPACPQDAAA